MSSPAVRLQCVGRMRVVLSAKCLPYYLPLLPLPLFRVTSTSTIFPQTTVQFLLACLSPFPMSTVAGTSASSFQVVFLRRYITLVVNDTQPHLQWFSLITPAQHVTLDAATVLIFTRTAKIHKLPPTRGNL